MHLLWIKEKKQEDATLSYLWTDAVRNRGEAESSYGKLWTKLSRARPSELRVMFPLVSIPAEKAQQTFYEREEGEKAEEQRSEKREQERRGETRLTRNGQASINQALSVGYGIYRE